MVPYLKRSMCVCYLLLQQSSQMLGAFFFSLFSPRHVPEGNFVVRIFLSSVRVQVASSASSSIVGRLLVLSMISRYPPPTHDDHQVYLPAIVLLVFWFGQFCLDKTAQMIVNSFPPVPRTYGPHIIIPGVLWEYIL